MLRENMTDLQKTAFDCYNNTVIKYSVAEAEDVIRKAIINEIGEPPARKEKMNRWFEKNKVRFYELLEEVLEPLVNLPKLTDLGGYILVESCDFGDKKTYKVKNKDLFKVSQIATGVGMTDRQRLHDSKLDTKMTRLGIKIYEEAFEFLTGRVSWTELVNKVKDSFDHTVTMMVIQTVFDAYDVVNTNLKATTNADGVGDKLKQMIAKVKGATGVEPVVLGTKSALATIPNSGGNDYVLDNEDRRNGGYVKLFEGTRCVELTQYYDVENNKFHIPDDYLIITVPDANGKLAVVTYEGGVTILDSNDTLARKDYQLEMEMERFVHVGVPVAMHFAMIKISA
jgi:hypothetical protein|nr:MAG TPA: capsid protein [Caudoviricetes sp.]DAZ34318.1 MAG TPA: capsid protein [Caudoviricetes sp.]